MKTGASTNGSDDSARQWRIVNAFSTPAREQCRSPLKRTVRGKARKNAKGPYPVDGPLKKTQRPIGRDFASEASCVAHPPLHLTVLLPSAAPTTGTPLHQGARSIASQTADRI
ncbi:MAG TPA: hypothetical protein VIM34_19895 [Burkholderiaceae bacterium]